MLTYARLRELLVYDPDLGIFIWLAGKRRNQIAGGYKGLPGARDAKYRRIKIDGRKYRTGRLAWLWMTGAWPEGEIDHVDRTRDNDCWSNLRDLPGVANQMNKHGPYKPKSLFG